MSGFCKYYKQKRQVSYDSGATWQDVVPAEYQKGELYEPNSSDCNYQIVERWVVVSGEYMCVGTTKYTKEIKQISYDGGQTWNNTSDYRKGTAIEYFSTDCGYTGFTGKILEIYDGGIIYSAECDSSVVLTSGETKPLGYELSSMKKAVIGDCVINVAELAFERCIGLTDIIIPDSVGLIGYGAFADCSGLTSVYIPDSVIYIGNNAFEGCTGLTSVNIPSGITSIRSRTFAGCTSLSNIQIPDSVTSIGVAALGWCSSLSSCTIGSGITSIEATAFYCCNNLSKVNSNTAGVCNLPSGLTSIGDDAFSNCFNLTSINMPDSVTSIGKAAFAGCYRLTSVRIEATTPPTLGSLGMVFYNTNDCPIYVPSGSVNAYKTASGWSEYANRIQAIP